VFTLDFTGSGKREALFCTGVRFYLWHFKNCLIVNKYAVSGSRSQFMGVPR